MAAVCPSCGVAVVPGYARCPKCRAALPYGGGRAMATGGTTVRQGGFPVFTALLVGGVIAATIAIAFAMREGPKRTAQKASPAAPVATTTTEAPIASAAPPPSPGSAAARPDPGAAAANFERSLQRQRLWSKVETFGGRVEIRSDSCAEPAMAQMIQAATESLRAAGLTRVRCLAQSGAVVLERDL